MKKHLQFSLTILLILLLSSCSFFTPGGTTTNNVVIREVELGAVTVEDLQTLIQQTIEKVEQSVIAVTFIDGVIVQTTSLGSGVIVEREVVLKPDDSIKHYRYTVITNRHVIMNDDKLVSNIKVYLGMVDLTLAADFIYYDKYVDLAIIKFNTTLYLPVATIGDSTKLKKGSFAIALGNPYSFDFYSSATFGIVSHPLRYMEDDIFGSPLTYSNSYIQHDVAINSGNSGGGLFDIFGNLIGINTLKIIGKDHEIDNMGFSIPSETVKQILAKAK